MPNTLWISRCVVVRRGCPGSSMRCRISRGMVPLGTSKTAGSFMSFQNPAMPRSTLKIFKKPPPLSRLPPAGKKRRAARPGPPFPHIISAGGVVHEVFPRHSCVVGRVVFARQVCDMKISNGDYVDSLLVQIADHLIKGWELCRIDRERTVLNLIIDIEINDIDGNLLLPEGICNLPHTRLSFVTVARLLKSKSPLRWKGRPSYKVSQVHQHLLGRGAIDEVVVKITAIGAEAERIAQFGSEVEAGTVCVVEKRSVANSVFAE